MSVPRTYSAEEVDAAVQAISAPDRLGHAEEVVTHAAPALGRILDQALEEGGYLAASGPQIAEVARIEDLVERIEAFRTMVSEEARLGMLVGAAVGFELARELMDEDASRPPHPEET